jgi:iron complex outermembrane receptor protein
MSGRQWNALLCVALCVGTSVAHAQHSSDNAVVAADDGFGLTIGTESLGIYNSSQVRGFNPQTAGNGRVSGLYFDQQLGALSPRILEGSSIKVGISSLGYFFPAPTGIVDFDLRHVSDKPATTVVLYAGPFETNAVDIDSQIPLVAGTLYLPIGVSYRTDAPFQGLTARAVGFGLTPLWKANDQLTIRLIVDWQQVTQSKSMPVIFMRDSEVPASRPPRYFGQNWAQDDYQYRTYGAIATASLSRRWTLAGGVFRSFYANPVGYSEFYVDTSLAGLGRHISVGSADQSETTDSGELRLSGEFSEGARRHQLVICARGYQSWSEYGGSDERNLGLGSIYQPVPVPRPGFVYSARSHDRTHLWTGGAAYRLQWARRGEMALGLEKSQYVKTVAAADEPASSSRKTPWRAYANTSLQMGPRWSVYAGYTQGFEDSGTAPANAANRGAILPASLTWQRDAGSRYTPAPGVTFTAGVFDVHKPYFNTNSTNAYVQLGRQSHRGVEFSLSGQMAAGLTVVVGGELLHPQVNTSQAAADSTGKSAVGLPHHLIQISVDYRLPGWAALSVDAVLTHYGWSAASIDNAARLPAHANLDVGAHYRFSLCGSPASLRLQLLNVADEFAWASTDSGGLTPQAPRRLQAYITVDL